MSSPSLTEGLALIESASISIQKSMHHVPLKEIEDAKKSFDFYAQVSNDFVSFMSPPYSTVYCVFGY